MATAELIFQITPRGSADFKSTMAQVRSELTQSGQTSTTVAKGELSTRQQLAAAASLQRQRSAALIGEWKRTETAAANLVKGVQPVGTNLQKITDIMQGLRGTAATLEGPLGGVAGRLGAVSSLISSLGGPLGIAVVGVTALAAGTVLLGKALFDASVSTAAWQGKLYDLSQQTGVSVETLSALEHVAENTGSSIEAIAASLGIFQRNLEDTLDPTSKMAKLFNQLGIETLNTEDAFSQTLLKLSQMPEGFRQTATALELFGRGGKAVLAILKETGGDLEATKEKLRELGILLDTETSRAADEFNDTLNTVNRQLKATVALLVRDVTPQILSSLQGISAALKNNQSAIQAWGQTVGDVLRGARIIAQSQFGLMIKDAAEFSIKWLTLQGLIYQGLSLLGAANRPSAAATAQQQRQSRFDQLGQRAMDANAVAELNKKDKKGGKGRTPRDTSLRDSVRDAELAEREITQRLNADVAENKRALEEQARDIEEFTRRGIELAEQRHDAAVVRINAEIAALDDAFAKKLIKQREYDQKSREIDIDNAEAAQKFADEKWELEQKRDKDRAAAEFAAHQRSVQLAEDASDRLIRNIEDRIDQEEIAESEGAKQIAVLIEQGYIRRKELLDDELTRITTSVERKAALNDELIRLDGERAAAAEDAARRIREARESELPQRPRRVKDATRPRSVEEDEFGKPLTEDPWDRSSIDQLHEHFEDLRAATSASAEDTGLIAMQAGIVALTDAFQGLGQAIGQVVEAWVLYGSAGTSVRKVTAQILAGVAQQAAVKAVFELAEGFAALALAFFGLPNAGPSAAAHFTAAAIYGTIAGVAAIAGRAVAGDAFTKQAGGTTGGSGSRESTAPERRGQPTTVDVNRRTNAQPQMITNEIVFRVKGDAVIDEFVRDYDLNGRTRIKILTDGQG